MTNKNKKLIEELEKIMEGMQDDNDQEALQKAMDYWCSMWDIREGMKHAIMLTLYDQYNNHESEQDEKGLAELKDILLTKTQ